jgi:capsular polysaccharide biosynthesis protein
MEKMRLQREHSINAQMYADIQLRYEKAQMTDTLEAADRLTRFTVMERASYEPQPIRPHKKMVWAMGTFLGMIVGIAVSFVREFTDTSFRNLDDASRYLDMPVLGVIPEVVNSTKPRRAAQSKVA